MRILARWFCIRDRAELVAVRCRAPSVRMHNCIYWNVRTPRATATRRNYQLNQLADTQHPHTNARAEDALTTYIGNPLGAHSLSLSLGRIQNANQFNGPFETCMGIHYAYMYVGQWNCGVERRGMTNITLHTDLIGCRRVWKVRMVCTRARACVWNSNLHHSERGCRRLCRRRCRRLLAGCLLQKCVWCYLGGHVGTKVANVYLSKNITGNQTQIQGTASRTKKYITLCNIT